MAVNISRLTPERPSGGWRGAVVRRSVDAALVLAVFFGLRAIGVDPWPALAICFVPPRGAEAGD